MVSESNDYWVYRADHSFFCLFCTDVPVHQYRDNLVFSADSGGLNRYWFWIAESHILKHHEF